MGFGTINTHIILFIAVTGAAALFVGELVMTTHETQTRTPSETTQNTDALQTDYSIISVNIQTQEANETETDKCETMPCLNTTGSIHLQNKGQPLQTENIEVLLGNYKVQNTTFVRPDDIQYENERVLSRNEIIRIDIQQVRETAQEPSEVSIRLGSVKRTKGGI